MDERRARSRPRGRAEARPEMLELGFVLLPVAALGATIVFVLRLHYRRMRAWGEAAAACGLQVGEPSIWSGKLTARAGLVTVTIEKSGNKGQYTRIIVWVPGPSDFPNVRIRREPLLRLGREIEIGDPSFDSTFFIEGPVRLVLAMLDAETRRLLVRVNAESRLEISTGALRALDMSDEKVSRVLPLLLDAGRRLPQQTEIPRRLAENANRDPEAGVRLQNLLFMIRELPGNPMTLEALRTARSDPSSVIRLRAARALGAEGRDLLLDLAESLEDDAVSAEAVSALDRELLFERTRAILDQARRRRRIRTASACLTALGTSGDASAVDALAEVRAREQGELAAAAAVALGATGSPTAEPSLLDAFQRGQADLRVAAASALGRVGSVMA